LQDAATKDLIALIQASKEQVSRCKRIEKIVDQVPITFRHLHPLVLHLKNPLTSTSRQIISNVQGDPSVPSLQAKAQSMFDALECLADAFHQGLEQKVGSSVEGQGESSSITLQSPRFFPANWPAGSPRCFTLSHLIVLLAFLASLCLSVWPSG
jgi:hypothetical protein